MDRVMENSCHTCKHYDVEGRDIVDYGSTTARLPETTVCMMFWDDEAEDFKEKEMIKQMDNCRSCKFYESTSPIEKGLFNGW